MSAKDEPPGTCRRVSTVKASRRRRRRSERVFDTVFQAERSKLIALAWSMTGEEHAAVELVQDVFLSAFDDWERISQYDNVGAWLRRVTINRSISWQRRDRSERDAVEKLAYISEVDRTTPVSASDGVSVDDGFWSLVRELAPRQQAVIVLRYVEDLSVDETADVLGIEAGTVKSAAAAGRARLVDALEARRRQDGVEQSRG